MDPNRVDVMILRLFWTSRRASWFSFLHSALIYQIWTKLTIKKSFSWKSIMFANVLILKIFAWRALGYYLIVMLCLISPLHYAQALRNTIFWPGSHFLEGKLSKSGSQCFFSRSEIVKRKTKSFMFRLDFDNKCVFLSFSKLLVSSQTLRGSLKKMVIEGLIFLMLSFLMLARSVM